MLDSAYARAAVFSLNKWGGKTIEQAQEIVANNTRDKVEDMTQAEGSVVSGFNALIDVFRKYGMEVSEEQKTDLLSVILDGPIDALTMEQFKSSLVEIDKEALALDALTAIHDNWVRGSEAKVSDSERINKRYMHTPLEMLGWETLESDYIFLKSVMECMGVPIEDDKKLIERYNERQVKYFERNGITDKETLAKHIKDLPATYEPLAAYSEENKNRFFIPKISNKGIIFEFPKSKDVYEVEIIKKMKNYDDKCAAWGSKDLYAKAERLK
jgi:hypothetical protein